MKGFPKKLSRVSGTIAAGLLLLFGMFGGGLLVPVADAAVDVSQEPLTLSNNVPGNLVLTPSVEWPTVMSMANIGSFDGSKTYYGYFDPNKCYSYQIADSSVPAFIGVNGGTHNYFKPVSTTSNRQCSGAWSGNYLNWAGTQTIDSFRSALTGGYRVVDTTTMTILEKARHTGQTSTGDLAISGSSVVSANTPFNHGYFYTRLKGLGNKMYFIVADSTSVKDRYDHYQSLRYLLNNPSDAKSKGAVEYDPSQTVNEGWVYSVNVDVQVCVPGLLESNCVQYGSNYKPEGLIQKYSKTFTYSVFGYLNISKTLQDGAALRAQQQFVGPDSYDPTAGAQANPHAEWDASTGVFVKNPDPTSASDTTNDYSTNPTIQNSGIINYINQFGEMTASNDKSYDPVSELYYAAIRYLKNQGAVASYNDMSTYADGSTYKMADGFPVIKTWKDPWKYSCQRSFILGIGDVNTWYDKNLPGNVNNYGEPPVPTEVSSDNTVNVKTATAKIAQLEGITINGMAAGGTSSSDSFSGRGNSAYIAGLAYDSHTKDMRPDLTGKQTVSTYWVDVMENQVLKSKSHNQYWLAAKYGGFKVPNNYDPYTNTTPLPDSWWWTNGQTLSTGDKRPDNFFTGGDAHTMVTSLEAAFSAIASENAGSIASLSTNTTQLNSGTTVYQASYAEGIWSGSLKAYAVDPVTQAVSGAPLWDAATVMPSYTARTIYTLVGGSYVPFDATNVSGHSGWTTDLVNYIRGDSQNEVQNGGSFRNRTTSLGDIIDSQPVYVGKPDPGPYANATFTGSTGLATFIANNASRTPTVYVAANDGMLHGFNASTGVETYAYMPGAVLTESVNPSVMAQTNYGSGLNPHQDFNDGELTVADAYFPSTGTWRTVLVGTTGRGMAKAIYALDVTDPSNVKFLWEKTAVDNGAIGQITGKPVVAQTADGVWSVLAGNGYNSPNGTAALLQINLETGAVSVHDTNTTQTDNGLAQPAVWIGNVSSGLSTVAYAGDLKGNVWSFDLSVANSNGVLVFTAEDSNNHPQPITAPMLAGRDPTTGKRWLFFGTGKYFGGGDLYDTQVQTWYGLVVDPATFPLSKTALVQRSIIAEQAGSPGDPTATPPVPPTLPARAFSTGTAGDMNGKSGWYLDLVSPNNGAEGERMIVANQFASNLLIGTSLIPETSDVCSPGGRGWVMALNPFTGTNPSSVFFDINGDRIFDTSDMISVNGTLIPAGGIGFASLTGSPAFVGTVMLANQNGNIASTAINQTSLNPGRVSWREIVRQ